uniref:Uncharacterized protein n=1 Tax=Sphaerodactylus townsendi TaxID=933632 RepID=A0ACB8FLY8_9SAUR
MPGDRHQPLTEAIGQMLALQRRSPSWEVAEGGEASWQETSARRPCFQAGYYQLQGGRSCEQTIGEDPGGRSPQRRGFLHTSEALVILVLTAAGVEWTFHIATFGAPTTFHYNMGLELTSQFGGGHYGSQKGQMSFGSGEIPTSFRSKTEKLRRSFDSGDISEDEGSQHGLQQLHKLPQEDKPDSPPASVEEGLCGRSLKSFEGHQNCGGVPEAQGGPKWILVQEDSPDEGKGELQLPEASPGSGGGDLEDCRPMGSKALFSLRDQKLHSFQAICFKTQRLLVPGTVKSEAPLQIQEKQACVAVHGALRMKPKCSKRLLLRVKRHLEFQGPSKESQKEMLKDFEGTLEPPLCQKMR